MTQYLALSLPELMILAGITFVAGTVRGFSGFALSAIVMASAVTILPPSQLIPICWWLELLASLMMLKDGWRDANRRLAFVLVLGTTAGMPLGLWLTLSIDPDTSRIVALTVLIVLAVLQLAKVRLGFLASTGGLVATGLTAGVVTGLSGAGGMVVALYVLASQVPAREMRGSLVLFLLGGSITSMGTHLIYGTMDGLAVSRGLILLPIVALGVLLGQRLFTPRLAPYYRPFCLTLLVGLAAVSLVRTTL